MSEPRDWILCLDRDGGLIGAYAGHGSQPCVRPPGGELVLVREVLTESAPQTVVPLSLTSEAQAEEGSPSTVRDAVRGELRGRRYARALEHFDAAFRHFKMGATSGLIVIEERSDGKVGFTRYGQMKPSTILALEDLIADYRQRLSRARLRKIRDEVDLEVLASEEEGPRVNEDEARLVFVVRADLEMGTGKLASQVAHALHRLLEDEVTGAGAAWMKRWRKLPTKIFLQVSSEEELAELAELAMTAGLPTYPITDAGRTWFKGVPTTTCIAIGPAPKALLEPITGKLRLLS